MTYLKSALLVGLAWIAPVQPMLTATAVLITIDFITGVAAAYKRKEPVNSAGFSRTLAKFAVYELALVLAFVGEQYLAPWCPIVKMVSGVACLTEVTSCFENLDCIAGQSLLKSVIAKLSSNNDKPD